MSAIVRYISFCLLMFASQPVFAQNAKDTLSIFFNLGNPALTQKATASIDQWLYDDIITHKQNILIVGYADHLGGNEYNDELSRNRATNVQDYLVGMGIQKENIKLLVGKGEVKRVVERTDGYPSDRRVDIILLDSQATASAPPKPVPPAVRKTAQRSGTPEIQIAHLKPGETIVLDKIYFYTGRHVVRQESIAELDKLYTALVKNPEVRIQVEGHVCCVEKHQDALDTDTFEMALSVNRARHICEYLVKRGISPKRLEYRGFGGSRPIVEDEKTPEDEDKNKRVEIRVLASKS